MNIFNTYTRRCLKKNRMRTIVTIVGIILSMTMLTAVVEGANSGLSYLARAEEARNGACHGVFYDVPQEEAEAILQSEDIAKTALWSQIGWAEIENSSGSTPYLLIEDMGVDTDLVAVRLKEGRLPENEGEIILPANLMRYRDAIEEGETLTLQVGDRVDAQGNPLSQLTYAQEGETLVNTVEKTYTVVGIYERLAPFVEPYDSAGFTALTCGGGTGNYMVFFTIKHPARFYTYMAECSFPYVSSAHGDLMSYYGAFRGGGLSQMYIGLVTVLLVIVGVGSVLLIYNSFSISVTQRITQFGILKSIGATRKQIRGSVLYEALLLSCIAIPFGAFIGCLGIGVTLYLLRDSFGFLTMSNEVQMRLSISWPGLGVAAVLCLLTTLISTWIPAQRALRVSPIEAIRSVREVKLRPREVRTGKLTYKLFGFEGMLAQKSFKRSRRQYRITVLSLTLSVVLFLSASAFCAYMEASITGVTQAEGIQEADILYRRWFNEEDAQTSKAEEVYQRLMNADEVEEGVYFVSYSEILSFDEDSLTKDAAALVNDYYIHGDSAGGAYLLFLRDDSFRELCEANGLDADAYMNADSPVAVVWNQCTVMEETDQGTSKLRQVEWFDTFPTTCQYWDIPETLEEEGEIWNLYGVEDGEILYYQPETWEGDDEGLKRVLAQEVITTQTLPVGAELKERPFFLEYADAVYLIYPFSAQATLLPDQGTTISYLFKAENHAAAFADMENLIWDGEGYISDLTASHENERTMLLVMRVFSYGFIVLISLIAMANVFNTISTGLMLRRREFAMLKSVGLTEKSFHKMMRYECLIYGIKGLFWGLLLSFGIIYLLYHITMDSMDVGFFVPWGSVAVAVGSVFAVVFATMLYAVGQMKGDNPVETLKNENL